MERRNIPPGSKAQRGPEVEVDTGHMRILGDQERSESRADVPGVREEAPEHPGEHPARAPVPQQLSVERRIRHTIPAAPVSGLHERLQGALRDVVAEAAVYSHMSRLALRGKRPGTVLNVYVGAQRAVGVAQRSR